MLPLFLLPILSHFLSNCSCRVERIQEREGETEIEGGGEARETEREREREREREYSDVCNDF